MGWLALAVGVPVYFNRLAASEFEPTKTLLLQTTGLLMLGGALIWFGEAGRRWRDRLPPLDRPGWILGWAALAYLGAWILSTFLSLAPRVSFWGWVGRPMGSATVVALFTLFALVGLFLRTREQQSRLVSVLLLGSLPVSLFGLVQHLGWDPTRYTGPGHILMWKVRSTFGNHIYVAAYLAMVIPLALVRLLETRDRLRQWVHRAPAKAAAPWAPVLVRLGLLGGQLLLLAVFFIASTNRTTVWWAFLPVLAGYLLLFLRAPRMPASRLGLWLEGAGYGVLLALQLTVVALTAARGPWLGLAAGLVAFGLLWTLGEGRRRWAAAFVGVVAVTVTVVAILNLPSSPLESLKANRLVRRLGSFWETREGSPGGVRLALWRGALSLTARPPAIGGDPFQAARPLVGFGPDMAVVALEQALPTHFRSEANHNLVAERVHNVLLDHLVERGLVGVLAYVSLIVVAAWVGLRRWRQAGATRDRLLVIGCLAALVAHLVERQTGIPIVGTEALAWIFLALLVRDPALIPAESPVAEAKARRGRTRSSPARPGPSWAVVLAPGYVGSLAIVLLFLAAADPPRSALGWTVGAFAWWWLGLGIATLAPVARDPLPWRQGSLLWHGLVSLVIVVSLGFLLAASAADVFYGVGHDDMMVRRDPTAALPAFQQAVRLSPGDAQYRSAMAGALVALAQQGGPGDSRPGQLQSTRSPAAIQGQARTKLLAAAAQAVEEARRLNPVNFKHHVEAGSLYRLQAGAGDREALERATQAYRQALALAPYRGWIYPELAIVLHVKGEPAEAAALAQRGLTLDGRLWAGAFVLALAYRDLGRREEALIQARRAVALAPADQRPGAQHLLADLERGAP